MKVLSAVSDCYLGGAYKVAQDVQNLVLSEDENLEAAFKVFTSCDPKLIFKPINRLVWASRWISMVSGFRPDLVIAHNPICLILSRVAKRCIFVVHGPILIPGRPSFAGLIASFYNLFALHLCDKAVCVSHGIKSGLPLRYRDKAEVIYNRPGESLSIGHVKDLSLTRIRTHRLKLFHFARISKQKNSLFLLGLMRYSILMGYDVQLLIVGRGATSPDFVSY